MKNRLGPVGMNLGYMSFVRHYNPADIDKSTRVDMGDFVILSSQRQTVPSFPSADIESPQDGIVAITDLLI